MEQTILLWAGRQNWVALLRYLAPLLLLCVGVALLFVARRRRLASPATPMSDCAALPLAYAAAADQLAMTMQSALRPGEPSAAGRDTLARAAQRLVDASQQAGAGRVGGWARALEHAAHTADPQTLGDLFAALEEERRVPPSGR